MSQSRLQGRLDQVRRRQLVITVAAGLCWGFSCAVLVLLTGMWLDLLWELSPRARIAVAVMAALAGSCLLGGLGARAFRVARAAWAARQLDRAGGCGGAILSGWELASSDDLLRERPKLTRGLAQLAVARAAALASGIAPARAVSSQPARRAAAACGALVAAVAALALCLPALVGAQWRRLVDPYGDVPPYSRLEFHVEPGDTRVVYGGSLEVRATVSGAPVERLELVFESTAATELLPMFGESGEVWRASVARVTEPASYFVRVDRARSARFRLEIITVPQIESVQFQVVPPDYTRDPVYEGPLPKDGLAGLAGTRVRVTASSNRPLAHGALDLTHEDGTRRVTLEPAVAGGSEVAGEFVIHASGKFELRVVDTAEQASQASLAGTITCLDDHRPFVRVLEPPAPSLATPEAKLPVTVTAEDDYGVQRLQLYRSLNNSRPLPLELPIDDPPRRQQQSRLDLPLEQYGLEPGDEIKLFARVEDNDPAQAKGAESGVVTIHIVSQEDFERMVRVRQGVEVLISKYEQGRRRLEKAAEELDQLQQKIALLPPDSPAANDLRQVLQRLAENMRQEAAAIDESARHLLPYALDESLTQQLRQLAETLRQSAELVEQAAAEAGAPHRQLAGQLAHAAHRLKEFRRQFQQQVSEPLEQLARIYPLLEDESRFVALAMRQRDLAERMAALKGHDGEDNPALKARMRDLESEQRRVREELGELLVDIEEHVTRLPDDPQLTTLRETALDFAEAVRGSGVSDVMTDAESALADFAGTRAHERATSAADTLERFLSRCQGMGEACQSCFGLKFAPAMSESLGTTAEQLLREAGLKPGRGAGPGFGQGQGGYSARRGAMSNVGLYGSLPALGPQGSGRRSGDPAASASSAKSFAGGRGSDEPSQVRAAETGAASGAGQGTIPLRYRQRVGQYFQRLAEELAN